MPFGIAGYASFINNILASLRRHKQCSDAVLCLQRRFLLGVGTFSFGCGNVFLCPHAIELNVAVLFFFFCKTKKS